MIRLINEQNATGLTSCLPQRPYYKFLASHQSMATLAELVAPYMHDALIATEMEWYVTGLISQIADRVGGRFLHCLAYQTAVNSRTMIHSERAEIAYLYCASWYDAAFLPALASHTRGVTDLAYHATCRLVDRAFKHDDAKLVSIALERLSFFSPEGWASGHPVLEYQLAQARYSHLLGKSVDTAKLAQLIHQYGNKYHRRIYLHELSTFLPVAPELVAAMAGAAEQGGEDEKTAPTA
jgi:hypothetical protein